MAAFGERKPMKIRLLPIFLVSFTWISCGPSALNHAKSLLANETIACSGEHKWLSKDGFYHVEFAGCTLPAALKQKAIDYAVKLEVPSAAGAKFSSQKIRCHVLTQKCDVIFDTLGGK